MRIYWDLTMKLNLPLIAVIVLAPTTASAYIEPGSALMVSQILIGAIIGGLVSLKLYWHRIKTKFIGSRGEDDQQKKPADNLSNSQES